MIDVYAQTISLPKLAYFGLGPSSDRAGKSYYGMGEHIIGSSVIYPIATSAIGGLNLSLLGEINYRGVDIRSSDADNLPSIEQVYTEATAPGLTSQPGFGQFGEGVRIKPSLLNGHLQLNYMTRWQQFVAGDSAYSFQRWTLDLNHEIPIRGTVTATPPENFNPNDCPRGTADAGCLPVSRNRYGTLNLRMFMARSDVSDTASVPFYFQPTLGGSDINGNRVLPSYEDYRFRGPNALLFQESIERAIGSTPDRRVDRVGPGPGVLRGRRRRRVPGDVLGRPDAACRRLPGRPAVVRHRRPGGSPRRADDQHVIARRVVEAVVILRIGIGSRGSQGFEGFEGARC